MADARLELVERFEDLRVSDIVVIRPCACGGRHRGLLIGRPAEWCFEFEPRPSCLRIGVPVVGRGAVEAKLVFREIIPPAEETEERAAAKPKERVR